MSSSDPVLTPRQAQIAELVARGLPSKAISEQLDIKPRTVEMHILQAAQRLPGNSSPRHRLTVHVIRQQAADSPGGKG